LTAAGKAAAGQKGLAFMGWPFCIMHKGVRCRHLAVPQKNPKKS
jgi:hypothetical protein